MKRKITYIFIILLILLGLNLIISSKSYATLKSGTIGTCYWEITDDGTLIIHEGTINSDDVPFYYYSRYPWDNSNLIKEVKIDGNVILNASGDSMFHCLYNCKKIDLTGLINNSNNISMFYGCTSLININFANIDTSNVNDMTGMFSGCSSLTELDLSNFDTSNVTSMSWMFNNCSSLTKLDLSNFDTSKVTEMSYMFNNCSSLTKLDLSNFDTSNVTYMGCMFYDCSSLEEIVVLKNWNILSSCLNFDMFKNDSNLIGGNGTVYDENHIDGTYAKIDNTKQQGYFTCNYEINIINSENNTNNISSNIIINYGDDNNIILMPNLGYEIEKIIDNDKEIEVNSVEEYNYVLENVVEDHNIKVITKAIEYEIISGNNQERTENKTEDLIIKSDGLFEIFTGLEINGKELVKDTDYKVEKGSTIVTISKDYLDTLDKGNYEIKFKYSNGSEPVGNMKITKEVATVSNNSQSNVSNLESGVSAGNGVTGNLVRALYTGDNILKVTIPAILIIIVLNIIQVKLQKDGKVNKKPRIGRK